MTGAVGGIDNGRDPESWIDESFPDSPIEELLLTNPFEVLLLGGQLSSTDLEHAEQIAGSTRKRLALTLVLLGMVGEDELATAMAHFAHSVQAEADWHAVAGPDIPNLNPYFLRDRHIVPLDLEGGNLTLVVADPTDLDAIEALRFAADATSVTVYISTFAQIDEALARLFPVEETVDATTSRDTSLHDLERLTDSTSDAPIIRLVQRLLATASTRKASDVHIEPMARQIVVRYRIDGRLVEAERLSTALAGPIALRIKVLAGLDIAETRLPQDGRLRFTTRGNNIDVRVSTSPVAHGESIVMRLLGRSANELGLEGLGLPAGVLGKLKQALAYPHGMILLTGPTGSGKTTTLYAALNHLKTPDVKILTVEDPVEIVVEGVNQVQVQPEIDLTYANALRAFLRQDPDILMIGEIRDRETADIAMRAALTGHLVLSTLHTNSAAGAFTRLADIGIEDFLTASTVIATMAQRLVRSLCPACAVKRPIQETERRLFHSCDLVPPDEVWERQGCPTCQNNGYVGRIPIMEIILLDDEAREAVRTRTVEALEQRQPRNETLFASGLHLVATGWTSISEVQRAIVLG